MPDGGRVTTGSEPTVRLHRCPECRQVRDTTDAAPYSIFQCEGWEDEPHAAQTMLPEAYAYEGPAADTDIVEPGHDEQTEEHDADLLRRAARVLNDNHLAGSQGARWDQLEESEQEYWITAVQAVLAAALDLDAKGYEWQPDPRTVAAVVEALRATHVSAIFGDREVYDDDLIDVFSGWIEERFKPSAPGGDDGH